MCGIVGIVGSEDVVPGVVRGLRRLEYRGYDSAGIAGIDDSSTLRRVRAAGKIDRLEDALKESPFTSVCAIGHTRWATHGRPTDENAHPHASCKGDVALVHNGIIENFDELRERLGSTGHELSTETDTEVIVHLVEQHFAACGRGGASDSLLEAVIATVGEVVGVHALAVVSQHEPDSIVVSTNGPPIVIGLGEGVNFIASDLTPILEHSRRVVYLEEGDTALVSRDAVEVRRPDGSVVERAPQTVDLNPVQAEKGGYKHFMLKEIHEQPRVLEDGLVGHVRPRSGEIVLDDLGMDEEALRSVERILILACGTSYHAGLVGKHLIQSLAGVPCDVEVASEFRYGDHLVGEGVLAIAITQSGETADTIGAMKEAERRGARLLVICNSLGSMATRIASGTLHMRAGIEIGVASTKCFTAEIVSLTLLALRLGQARGAVTAERSMELVEGLRSLPRLVEEMLSREKRVVEIAKQTVQANHYLFLGRGIMHPTAMEGALKLKEISYIHAEGYPAGEMKHGPIALIDESMPVVGLCIASRTYDKMVANVQEVKARDGVLIAVVTDGEAQVSKFADHVIEVPPVDELLAPVVVSVPLQLLAYHVAVRRGCDVDQPRNLAKSVTVE